MFAKTAQVVMTVAMFGCVSGCATERATEDASTARHEARERAARTEESSTTETTAAPMPMTASVDSAGTFDRAAAVTAVSAGLERASVCQRANGPSGSGHAVLTFDTDGSVANVALNAPYDQTEVGDCIANELLKASITPFTLPSGATTLSVGKNFALEPIQAPSASE